MSWSYPVCDVTTWTVVNPETVGREEKYWIRSPEARHPDSHEDDWLFKPVVVTAGGHRQGEDWSEKLAARLAQLAGVPCADVDLAVRAGVPGSISRNVTPDGWSFAHGAILLGRLLDGYVEGQQNPPGRPGHSLTVIMAALRECDGPPGHPDLDARSAFAGYLVLDAWIGNQDRHDQNWAVLREAVGSDVLRLAPSYDHASGLAFQRLDSFRSARLRDGTVGTFAANARAHRFEHDPHSPRSSRPTLVELAARGLDLAGGDARRHWLDRLDAAGDDEMAEIVACAPGLSEVTRTFVLELVRINRERLLRECR